MESTPQPNPIPQPTNPNPGALPLEVDPGGLHSRPEVDYNPAPQEPIQPESPPEREQPNGPEIEPGHEEGV